MATEFEDMFGICPEEAADKYAHLCADWINIMRDRGASPELTAFSAANIAASLCQLIGNAELAKLLAKMLILRHIELIGAAGDEPTVVVVEFDDDEETVH
jgi:hypothetical protein